MFGLPEITMFHLSVLLMALAPFYAIGISKVVEFVLGKIKIKRGFVSIFQITKNARLKVSFLKPKGKKIELEKKKPVPFSNKPGFMVFKGSTPTAIFSADGSQIDLRRGGAGKAIDKEYFSDLVTQAYNLGILVAAKRDDDAKKILFIVLILSAAAAVLSFLTWQGLPKA